MLLFHVKLGDILVFSWDTFAHISRLSRFAAGHCPMTFKPIIIPNQSCFCHGAINEIIKLSVRFLSKGKSPKNQENVEKKHSSFQIINYKFKTRTVTKIVVDGGNRLSKHFSGHFLTLHQNILERRGATNIWKLSSDFGLKTKQK